MTRYLMATEIKKIYNVGINSLKLWETQGILHPIRTPGGHRRYLENELMSAMGLGLETLKGNRCVIYARVSIQKQADSGNLNRQLERLRDIAKRRKYQVIAEFQEIASGLNENRRELTKLLNMVADGLTDIVFIEYKDRLARFGFRYLEQYCHKFNVVIVEGDDRPAKEPQEELVEDMIAIVTSFSARIYGKRGGKVAKKIVNLVETEVLKNENDS
ncbi:MAG: IS607 family transposase [Desulfitobacteriaceae bacterium]